MFLYLIEGAVNILIVTFVVTQVVIPLFRGKKLFPMFRKKKSEFEDSIDDYLKRF